MVSVEVQSITKCLNEYYGKYLLWSQWVDPLWYIIIKIELKIYTFYQIIKMRVDDSLNI